MIAAITLNPFFPLPVIGLILVLVLLVFILKERSEKKGLIIRVFFIFLALTGITGILLNPLLSGTSESYTILLTPGYDESIADSLLKINLNSQIMLSPGAEDYASGERIPSLNSLALSPPDIIIGDGIPEYISAMIHDSPFTYFPSKRKEGLVDIRIPQKIYENRYAMVKGISHSSQKKTLVLSGPTGVEDSISIPAGRHNFELGFIPKTPGRFTYQLSEFYNEHSLAHSVPVVVIEPSPLSVLMLLDYPTFESRALKNFLVKNHEVKVRYRVSKGVFRYEYHHTKPSRFNQLSSDLLDKADLVIMDNESYTNLSSTEKKLLETSVQSGLGLFILLNESPGKIMFLKSLLKTTFKTNAKDSTLFQLTSKKQIKLPVWNVSLENSESLRSLYESSNSIVSGYREIGIGKIGFSLWKETYPLLLDGDSVSYSTLWTQALEEITRKSAKGIELMMEGNPPYRVNEPVSFRIKSPGIKPEIHYLNSILPLREDAFVDNIWHGRIWADKTGWNTMHIYNDSSEFALYVHPENEWMTLRQDNLIKHTLSASADRITPKRNSEERKRINLLWFFLFFITGISLLWVWPKFRGNN